MVKKAIGTLVKIEQWTDYIKIMKTRPKKPVWIIKVEKSGKHIGYYTNKKIAIKMIRWYRYYQGFRYRKLKCVKGYVTE